MQRIFRIAGMLALIFLLVACRAQDSTEAEWIPPGGPSAVFNYVAVGDVPESRMLEISETLEEHRAAVLSNIGVDRIPRVNVKVWQDRTGFERDYGEDNAAVQGYLDIGNWEVNIFDGRPVMGLSAVHEFVHLVQVALNPTLPNNPRWLWESVAIYESNRPPRPDPATLPCLFPAGLPTLARLEDQPFDIYRMGYFLQEYLVEAWGREAVADLMRSNGAIREVLGVTEAEFQSGWQEYMNSTYGFEVDAGADCPADEQVTR